MYCQRSPRKVPGAGGVLQAAQRAAGGALAGSHCPDSLRRGLLSHRVSRRAAGPHRLRPPFRAHDVSGLGEPGQDGIHQARAEQRRDSQRFDTIRFHELFRGASLEQAGDRAVGRSRPHERPGRNRRQPEEPAGRGRQRSEGQRAERALWRVSVDRSAHGCQFELVQRPQFLRRPDRHRSGQARRGEEILCYLLRAQQRGAGDCRGFRQRGGEKIRRKVFRSHQAGAGSSPARPVRAAPGDRKANHKNRSPGPAPRAPRSPSATTCRTATRRNTTPWV